MNAFETWQVVLGSISAAILLATFLGALYVGFKANEINDRLRMLQDYTAVTVVPDKDNPLIKLFNVGKVNLYLWGFDIPGNNSRFERARFMPAGTNDAAYYYIPTPDLGSIRDNKFDFKLYLTDQFGNKWVTDAGGSVIANGRMIVWTYETSRNDWKF